MKQNFKKVDLIRDLFNSSRLIIVGLLLCVLTVYPTVIGITLTLIASLIQEIFYPKIKRIDNAIMERLKYHDRYYEMFHACRSGMFMILYSLHTDIYDGKSLDRFRKYENDKITIDGLEMSKMINSSELDSKNIIATQYYKKLFYDNKKFDLTIRNIDNVLVETSKIKHRSNIIEFDLLIDKVNDECISFKNMLPIYKKAWIDNLPDFNRTLITNRVTEHLNEINSNLDIINKILNEYLSSRRSAGIMDDEMCLSAFSSKQVYLMYQYFYGSYVYNFLKNEN